MALIWTIDDITMMNSDAADAAMLVDCYSIELVDAPIFEIFVRL